MKVNIVHADCGRSTKLIEVEWRIYASFNWAIIGSDNGISLIGPWKTHLSDIFINIQLSLKKVHLKMSGKWRPFCLGLKVFNASQAASSHRDKGGCYKTLMGCNFHYKSLTPFSKKQIQVVLQWSLGPFSEPFTICSWNRRKMFFQAGTFIVCVVKPSLNNDLGDLSTSIYCASRLMAGIPQMTSLRQDSLWLVA